jgi:hypothetical protein
VSPRKSRAHRGARLHLDRHDLSRWALYDHVDLALVFAIVPEAQRLGRPRRVALQLGRDECLEQRTRESVVGAYAVRVRADERGE